jgi:hypothetical protein
MYPILLALHSWTRWLVLLSLLFAVYRAYLGWKSAKPFSKFDDRVRVITISIAHTQLLLGLWLYFVSPIVDYFLKNFGSAVHMREIRFFGMEHVTMMVVAVTLLTIGSVKVKRAKEDQEKYKKMFFWFARVLLVIFLSIPWSFSPFTSRPLYRPF